MLISWQDVKCALLLMFAFPVLLLTVICGFGRALALTVVVCLHIAPDTTMACIHSRPVQMLWETVHKGM
jgi:hypothetical protein